MTAGSRWRRAAQALSDPWSLLAAAVGTGAAWALALPVGGVGAVGVGMLGVAAAVGALTRDTTRMTGEPPAEPELVVGTPQYRSVRTLDSYLDDLARFRSAVQSPMLEQRTADALDAARSARVVAVRAAGSIDALDAALARASQVAHQMTAADKVAGPIQRMAARRTALLDSLAGGVDGVGELYAKLLELSATPEVVDGTPVAVGPDPVLEVSDSLDALRGAFAELASAARSSDDRLDEGRS